MLFENYSVLLLVGHAASALACVALTTHLFLWLRRWSRGAKNHGSVRRFALWAFAAYGTTMLLGMALYPTYKVRVRAEYLDNPSAISRAAEEQANAARLAEARNRESRRFRSGAAGTPESLPALSPEDREAIAIAADRSTTRGAKLVRWFDVKEHWSALGIILAGSLALLLWVAPSEKPQRPVTRIILALALASSLITWFAATIGIIVTAARSVAGV